MPKISIIVPVFKTESYLKKCIEKLLNQTFSSFEIILVDDGSPDNCPTICDEYAKKDNRVLVIHKKNEGQALARNAGLKYALTQSNSNYISFVDSDDYVDTTFLEKLYNGISGYDISICLYNIDNDGKITLQGKTKKKVATADKYWKLNLGFAGTSVIWNKLYKKSIFANLLFRNTRLEDEFIIHHIISNTKKIGIVPENLYYYQKRTNSTMRTITKTDFLVTLFNVFIDRLELVSKNIKMRGLLEKTVNDYLYASSCYCNNGYYILLKDKMAVCNKLIKSIPIYVYKPNTIAKMFLWKTMFKNYYQIVDKKRKIKFR